MQWYAGLSHVIWFMARFLQSCSGWGAGKAGPASTWSCPSIFMDRFPIFHKQDCTWSAEGRECLQLQLLMLPPSSCGTIWSMTFSFESASCAAQPMSGHAGRQLAARAASRPPLAQPASSPLPSSHATPDAFVFTQGLLPTLS